MKKQTIMIFLGSVLLLSGCGASGPIMQPTENQTTVAAQTIQTTAAATTAAATSAAATTAAATTVAAEPTLPPNTSGKVEIRTISGALTTPFNSYLITSAEGETAVIDPLMMPSKKKLNIDPVIIASTHNHDDHNDQAFTNSYDCEKIIRKLADVEVGGFHVYTIESSHSNDVINSSGGNTLIVFEVNGLRIVHMGDIGQTSLTEEQLELIGPIDIAFMQFENTYSYMTLDNEKGFTLIEQLNPKIIIPTHYTENSIPVLVEKYGEIQYFDDLLAVSTDDLPQDTMNVYIIRNNYLFD